MRQLLTPLVGLVLGGMAPALAGGAELNLSWTNHGTEATGIVIERSIGRAGPFEPIAALPPDSDRYVDAQVEPGTEYCYRVRAYNAAGASGPSNVACAWSPSGAASTSVQPLEESTRSGAPARDDRRAGERQARPAAPPASAPSPAAPAAPASPAPAGGGDAMPREATGTGATAGGQAPASAAVGVEPAVDGLDHPVYLTHAADDSGRVFVVEQAGRIWPVEQGRRLGRPFLDIATRVDAGGDGGLLGLAFHPRYRANRRYVVAYTRVGDGALVVAEYRASDDPTLSETDERLVLVVPPPSSGPVGGMIEFGPDGFLYLGLGGGGTGDGGDRAQDPRELSGKILRIDVDRGRPYRVPPDNPWIGKGRPEVYALGFRDPSRFSFDPATGRLFAADVGSAGVDEINLVRRGGNYGWRLMEGSRCVDSPRRCRVAALEPPVAEHPREGGRCAVVGGYVYRGRRMPALVGTYLFGDRCSGEILALRGGRITTVGRTGLSIVSFGQDQARELYVVDRRGSIHRLVPGS
jgi:glucose/arabinose dehydrogenase